MRTVKINLPKARLWTSDSHYTASFHEEKRWQRRAVDRVVIKHRLLPQRGPGACFNHFQ